MISDNIVLNANHTVSHPVTSVPGFCTCKNAKI